MARGWSGGGVAASWPVGHVGRSDISSGRACVPRLVVVAARRHRLSVGLVDVLVTYEVPAGVGL